MKWWVLLMMVVLGAEAWAAGPVINRDCQITWSAPTTGTDGQPLNSPITGYTLYKGVAPGVYTGTVALPPTPTATTCRAVGITLNGQYSIALSASNAGGEGLKTADLPFLLNAPVAPATPGNLQVQ